MVRRVYGSSWWTLDLGSIPLLWRWPEEFIRDIINGVQSRFLVEAPKNLTRQPIIKDPGKRELCR